MRLINPSRDVESKDADASSSAVSYASMPVATRCVGEGVVRRKEEEGKQRRRKKLVTVRRTGSTQTNVCVLKCYTRHSAASVLVLVLFSLPVTGR